MTPKYTKEEMYEIIAIIVKYCDKIPAVSYYQAYKWMFGDKLLQRTLDGALDKIGSGKYIYPPLEKEDIMILVCQENGKSGMVFTENGIFYRADFFWAQAEYKDYENCYSVNSFMDLANDLSFSNDLVNAMFNEMQAVLKGARPMKEKEDASKAEEEQYNQKVREEFKRFLEAEEYDRNEEVDKIYWGKAEETQDINEKIKILTEGAEAGSAFCEQTLGELYFLGEKVEKDLVKAEKYLKKAVKYGWSSAMNYLGLFYIQTD